MSDKETISKTFDLRAFFEDAPPCKMVCLQDVTVSGGFISFPEIWYYCKREHCQGFRFFSPDDSSFHFSSENNETVKYTCNNCKGFGKMVSFMIIRKEDGSYNGYKFGEFPPFGPHIPSKLLKMVSDDKETLLKGSRCENQGLGIGAFAYYRRVIVNQKNKIIDEVIKVARKIKVDPSMIKTLEDAKKIGEFSKSMEMVKDAMPRTLLIDECHNPLTLLHNALSSRLHADTDEECLELAHSIRLVLTELAERMDQALKDQASLAQAVSRLMKPGQSGVEKPTKLN